MKKSDAVETQGHGQDNGRRTGQAAVALVSGQCLRAAPVVLLAAIVFVPPAQAQPPTKAPDCSPGRDLITIPEIKHENGKLRAVIMLTDEYRGMWDYRGDRCMWQHLRYFKGWNVKDWNAADPPPSWPSNGEPIPGPTLRARIGDLIQISFLNHSSFTN